MITKGMLKRCINEKKQAFCALDKEVQDAINDNKDFQQCLYFIKGKLSWENDDDEKPSPNYVYRLSPDTPTDPELEEREVRRDIFNPSKTESFVVDCSSIETREDYLALSLAVSCVRFLGIIYTLNGVETLRTSIDAAFGVPVRVRFSK